jgi:hypothetical protein
MHPRITAAVAAAQIQEKLRMSALRRLAYEDRVASRRVWRRLRRAPRRVEEQAVAPQTRAVQRTGERAA